MSACPRCASPETIAEATVTSDVMSGARTARVRYRCGAGHSRYADVAMEPEPVRAATEQHWRRPAAAVDPAPPPSRPLRIPSRGGARQRIGRPMVYTREMAERIARAWATGAAIADIADALGLRSESLRMGIQFCRARFPDVPLPRRRPFHRPARVRATA